MIREFEGKVALVTGGASGIGRATAVKFGVEGANVVVADVDQRGGQETVRMVKECGGDAIFVPTDVSEESDVIALIETTLATYGRLDYAVNNAGIEGRSAATADLASGDFDRTIAINLRGVWLCMKYELPHLLETGGSIVNMSSVAGLIGFAGSGAYVASKHGVIGLTKTTALEYSGQGVRVNAISPGVIMTPMVKRVGERGAGVLDVLEALHPIGRTGTPDEVAEATVWLCSNKASFITGVALPVDGGFVTQ